MVSFVIAVGVFADTTSLRPTGNTTYLAWETFTCDQSAKWQCVDEENLDTTDYLLESTPGDKHAFEFSNLPSGMGENVSITNVSVHYVGQANFYGDNEIEVFLINGSSAEYNSSLFLPEEWGERVKHFDLSPFTNSPWKYSEINDLQAGMIATNNANGGGKIAQMWINVTWFGW